MKILLPLSDVSDRAKVTKHTGAKVYVVRDKLSLFGAESSVVEAQPGVRFLIDPNSGNANAYPSSIEVLWELSERELRDWLNRRESERTHR